MNPEILYDLSTLKEIGKRNESFVKKMLDIFCEQTPLMIKEMTDAFYANDLEKMGSTAHKIKPSIDNLNIISLKQIIRQIELAGREEIEGPIVESSTLEGLIIETGIILNNVMNMMQTEYPTPISI